jgi:hypothetical protein
MLQPKRFLGEVSPGSEEVLIRDVDGSLSPQGFEGAKHGKASNQHANFETLGNHFLLPARGVTLS